MKALDTPRTNKIGNMVAYPSPYGQCYRTYCVPHDPKSPAQRHMRAVFGSASRGWGLNLTELQREHWVATSLQVPSHPSLEQYSHLSGQQLCVKINSTLRCVGQAPVNEPPALVVFTPNPVGDLVAVTDEASAVRLLLNVGPAAEDIMLFGQEPCSAGRMKHRRVYYLGLVGPATNGQCDVTAQYTARFGQPTPGQKIFIVTCQMKNGWKAEDHATNAIVPPRPLPEQPQSDWETKVEAAAVTGTPESLPTPAPVSSSAIHVVYKGSTPDARGLRNFLKREHPLSTLGTPLVHMVNIALAWLGTVGMPGARVGRTFSPGSSAANC